MAHHNTPNSNNEPNSSPFDPRVAVGDPARPAVKSADPLVLRRRPRAMLVRYRTAPVDDAILEGPSGTASPVRTRWRRTMP